MTIDQRQRRSHLVFSGIFLSLSLALIGLNSFLRFGPVAEWSGKYTLDQQRLDALKKQQVGLMEDGLKDLADRYSAGMGAVQSVFAARDAVFSGELENLSLKPVVFLNSPDFFLSLQKLLRKSAVLSNLTIGNGGEIAFVMKTSSYQEAGRQIAALRFGIAAEKPSLKNPSLVIPPLLIDFNISSVAMTVNAADENIPEILRAEPFIASFAVQARVNPEYFFALNEVKNAKTDELPSQQ
jgi:hypothetical protein